MQYIETDIISAGDKPPPYGFNYAQRNIIVRSTHHCVATSLRSNIIVAHRATCPRPTYNLIKIDAQIYA